MCQAFQSPWSRCSAPDPGCAYYFSYGDGTSTDGVLATETFTFGSNTAVHGVSFGCGTENLGGTDNSSGLLGITRFSYCFTPFNATAASPLFLGSSARLSSAARTTPFVPNPSGGARRRSSYYYLSLEGITVGHTLLLIDPSVFQLTPMGDGGVGKAGEGGDELHAAHTQEQPEEHPLLGSMLLAALDGLHFSSSSADGLAPLDMAEASCILTHVLGLQLEVVSEGGTCGRRWRDRTGTGMEMTM
uniref:Xylanase inhibitor N-terminal domain-containing protein n=1 Tax=Oryza punctata TaxID=4537 RepID=A0A0E0L8E7_ORYPU